jgi:hypothetical protein
VTNIRYSIRRLRQDTTLTIVVTLALALGIGANTAVFSVIEAALLRELPFPEPERLVVLHERSSSGMTSLAAALVGGRLMQRFLCDVAPIDLVSFAAVPLIVAAVTLVACLIPACRAMRIDPLVALRSE